MFEMNPRREHATLIRGITTTGDIVTSILISRSNELGVFCIFDPGTKYANEIFVPWSNVAYVSSVIEGSGVYPC